MSNKEPSRYQISSRLTYNEGPVPNFLQRLRNQVAGIDDQDTEEDDSNEWEAISGRPPIPRRPTSPRRHSPPSRPDGDPGSADEEDGDEKPQVVVLREGKHMTAREAENERRKARGLAPLPPDDLDMNKEMNLETETMQGKSTEEEKKRSSASSNSLSFSSSNAKTSERTSKKRKPIGEGSPKSQKKTKKIKGNSKSLLSFIDD